MVSNSLEETDQVAKDWLKEASERYRDAHEALVVGLSGNLGAGKTSFTKAVAKELGIKEDITSPTFVIMKMYDTDRSPWKKLIHIDAYRLERGEDLRVLGFEKLVADKTNLIIIEWPENVTETLERVSVYRVITFTLPENGSKDERVVEIME